MAEFRIPQMPEIVTEIPGPRSKELLARQASVVAGFLASYVDVYVDEIDGGIVQDVDGNRFVDFVAGIAVTGVGGSAPEVVDAVREQVGRFTHTAVTSAMHEPYVAAVEKLVSHAPGASKKKGILNSTGAEAVENAVKIARSVTGRQAIVVFDNAYHGRTNLALAMTAKATPYKVGFGPFAPEVYRVPGSYPYRDGLSGAEAAERALQIVERNIGSESVAAIVIEPIQGEGGFIVPADGFLQRLREWATDNGALLVFDEIQAGACRTGRWFSSEWWDVEPDLLTVAKGIAGGLPLSGVIGKAEIMDAAPRGGVGSGTYGGNPLACAAAVAALSKMEDERLDERALRLGEIMTTRLVEAAAAIPTIGDVRGKGAMIAIELVRPGTKDPLAELAKAIIPAAAARGVLVLDCGVAGNSLRLLPSLVMPEETLEEGLRILIDVVLECSRPWTGADAPATFATV